MSANTGAPAEFLAAVVSGIVTAEGVPAEKKLACLEEYMSGLIDEKVKDVVMKFKLAAIALGTEAWVEQHHEKNPDQPIKVGKN